MPTCYMHPSEILVSTLKRLYDFGMTTTSGGNLSIKDEDGNIWITPSGIDKGTLRPSDVIKVTPGGDMIGCHKPSCELPFHRSVYQLRPDVKAVLHAHAPALVAFSLTGRVPNPKLIPNCEKICGKIAFAKYEIPGSQKLGNVIAAEFKKGADSVIMENHGAVVCGDSIAQAFARFETLDYIARYEIQASGLGSVNSLSSTAEAGFANGTFQPGAPSPVECELRGKMVEFSARSYRQGLFFSGNSVIAAKVKGDSFLVTPNELDPLNVTAADMVLVKDGKTEAGKEAAPAAAICAEIFKQHDWVNAVMLTRAPNVMAFAATHQTLDSRTIPESYIMLRDMPMIKADQYLKDPASVAKLLKPSMPVLLIENVGILTTGKALLEAFDRMEVGEFTAKCILLANRIGKFAPINQQQVDDIIADFNLPKD